MYSPDSTFIFLYSSHLYIPFYRGRESRSSKSIGRRSSQLINQFVEPPPGGGGCGATLRITDRAVGMDTITETNPAYTARFPIHCKPGHRGKTSSS
jgi:hypothetical protein